ncbi:MAG: NAD-dependent epimerase [Candidatus Pacebacteria bacterium RIFOXYB1_FULL_39_46]|nr:MAG: NAD-dependent epimerase [Candidatus Pacebacteria bacterium RIFOXYB1_FULL_39_46]OGJ39034.1 MAG: NAD-dependent epimerase [Candidatus Pacebacteria bacterium RIFOXYA1_FULL_38_18]OGJ40005.1 MAG: NAD-dependent epimerase [Candidatus Pacebacteria bacterium RIFOXYD1_FULL_39_27]OGJ40733.1 MAG: NAD-dependent epimerase [Candidatus Pacebacteria bacterium RIFOXYC1_FULL_39_21]
MKRILVTGAFGLVGSDLVPELQKKFGPDSVVALARETVSSDFKGILEKGDVRDSKLMADLVKKHDIGEIYHLAGLLSAGGEKQPDLAWEINVDGLKHVLDLAKEHQLKVFWPSSIAAFGPSTPKQNVPQHTSLEPTTMYGVTKVTGELLCQYYFEKYGVDVRSLRYPGLNGYKAKPGDGTTEYAIHIFYGLVKDNYYECFLQADARLPMMYMDDAIKGTLALMAAPSEKITIRTSYNFAAISFTPEELYQEILKFAPDFKVEFKPDSRQKIAEGWPQTIDDSSARNDWGWKHEFDLPKMTQALYEGIKQKIN